MATMQAATEQAPKPEFKFNLITPFSTRIDGKSPPVPYVVDGLLTEGGFSILAAKPKQGKSSLSRCMAVCIAKGIPFLDRETTRGSVILISLEDPLFHVDNCLEALGYDPEIDAPIYIIEKLPPTVAESIRLLRELLANKPDIRLIVVDTLPKFIRVPDINEYMKVMAPVEQLHELAREFPHIHITALAHCKKVQTDNVFDSLLGSTALRGEPDTNIALYEDDHQRIIETETRIGKSLEATLIRADLVDIGGANVVQSYSLLKTLAEHQSSKKESREFKEQLSYEQRVIDSLKTRDGFTATQQSVLHDVEGRTEDLVAAIKSLAEAGVITITGKKHSPTDPLKLTFNPGAPNINQFIGRWMGK